MASAIAEQRQHGPDLGGDTLHQLRQTILVGAIQFAEQFFPDRTEIVLEGFAT